MNHSKIARLRRGATVLRQQFAQQSGSVFSRVFGERDIAVAVAPHVKDYRERIYPPLDTLRLFVGQVLSPDRACQDVVGRRLSERVARGKSVGTLNTGAYVTHVRVCPLISRLRWAAGLANALNPWRRGHGIGGTEPSSSLTAPPFRCPIRQAINRHFRKAVDRSLDWAIRCAHRRAHRAGQWHRARLPDCCL
jgi:hypothetical protein